ncbi:MAG: nicotinate phosphoribosyltransferase [Proteobacteria bacterium]|nr:nicotinate phosphoribosyltransferase [Pseudomonadota bacterium]
MQRKYTKKDTSIAMFTDLYQLTMGFGYWKLGKHQQESIFTLSIRENPFKGGYTICCGLELLIEALKDFAFTKSDIDYLQTLTGNDGSPLFSPEYLQYLLELKITSNIDAVREGSIVFPHEPLIRIQGPIIECQLLETLFLNLINFSSLISTKASRICWATEGEPVLEFGARRAQGVDGALTASRAAFIGGCHATSNVLAGKLYDIPVKGTHAHSWVMSFNNELESFNKYAECMPNNCTLLVDTYNTIEGTKRAIQIAKKLKSERHQPFGVRLDSGDLAYLSIEVRKLLDEAGLEAMKIVGSNDLDEEIIRSLKGQGSKVSIWGVGTNLITAAGQSALGGVYKMTAIKENGVWIDKIKLSEQTTKINTPGKLQIRRFFRKNGTPIADAIYDQAVPEPVKSWKIIDPVDPIRQKTVIKSDHWEDILIPVFVKGSCVYDSPPLVEIKEYCRKQLKTFHEGIKRIVNPHSYPAGIEDSLQQRKVELITRLRNTSLQSF